MSFSHSFLSLAQHRKTLRKEVFLDEMNTVIPWDELLSILDEARGHASSTGRPRTQTLLLLKIYFLQQWYNLSDPAVEEEIYDRVSFQKFLDLNVVSEAVPDETTMVRFRHFLEHHNLTEQLFSCIMDILKRKGLFLQKGTIVDATIIHASSSTKNKDKKRDPDMSSTKKNNTYHFGMKMHAGVDSRSRCIHAMRTTTAKVHDSEVFDDLLHGEEKAIFADKAYANKERKQKYRKQGIYYGITDKAYKNNPMSSSQKKHNRRKSTVRSRGEHPFHIIKNIFHYKKTRYRGLRKNTSQLYTLCFLSNLYLLRRALRSG